MFKTQHFYHQHVRKAIIAFGTLFNQIQVRRTNAQGEVVQSVFVPLSYAPKQKFIERIREVPDVDENRQPFAVTLPRIGFEITNFSYDPSRKLSITQPVRAVDTTQTTKTGTRYSHVATPYNMGISMSVFVKNQDDGLQIIEQILPYFNPDFNVTVNALPDLGVKHDIQIVLDSVTYNDEWEGSFDKRLSVIWDLNFTMKLNFYGYVTDAQLIKKTIIDLYNDSNLFAGKPPVNTIVGTEITTTVDPYNALPIDTYSYITDFDEIYTGD